MTRETLNRRLNGEAPKFDLVHVCPKCKVRFLCPDRYVTEECGPVREAEKHGWPTDQTCLPCLANFNDTDRTVWNDANAILS